MTTTEDFNSIKCIIISFTADGKTYRPFIAVNGLAPGPTLVVNEGQRMIVNVMNQLISGTTSIHWHGMDMRYTPWMDGVVQVTQCALNPQETFQYYFEPYPTGTYWYHAHRVEQRVDGLFGGLIIRESPQRFRYLEQVLGSTVIDSPGTQTVNLRQWDEGPIVDLYTKVKGELEFFPGKPVGVIPKPPSLQNGTMYTKYDSSKGPDGLEAGDIPFWSGLTNGKGRHKDIPYAETRLEVFTINNDNSSYHFRLVGSQSLYAYKFSIDEHVLTVVAADGILIEPVKTHFIIIHTGERYDFVIR